MTSQSGKTALRLVGIRVNEPECKENGEILWRLRKNPSDKQKNIMTIGIYEGHVSVFDQRDQKASKTLCVC